MGLKPSAEKAIRRMDSDVSEDTRAVLDAAAVLDVTEFELFGFAYRRWFGDEAPAERLERVFAHYMFHHETPPYVRLFTREVLRRERDGALRASDFGVPPPPDTPPDKRGPLFAWGLLALTLGYVAVLIATPVNSSTRSVMCAGSPVLGYTQTVASMFTGKPDPFDCKPK
jgi:hypothetical protein